MGLFPDRSSGVSFYIKIIKYLLKNENILVLNFGTKNALFDELETSVEHSLPSLLKALEHSYT